jgi:hypothetical protein
MYQGLALRTGDDPRRAGRRLRRALDEFVLSRTTAPFVRAEMSRLRALVGPGLLGSLPYRLRRLVRPDFLVVRDLLAEGRLREAVAAYPGPLLPASEAPTVVEYRRMLEQQLRGALLASGDPVLLRG